MMSKTTKESKTLLHSIKLNFNKKDKIIHKAKEIFKNFIPMKLTVSKKLSRLKNKKSDDFLKSTGNWSKTNKKDWQTLFQTIMSLKEKLKILFFIMKGKLSWWRLKFLNFTKLILRLLDQSFKTLMPLITEKLITWECYFEMSDNNWQEKFIQNWS